MTRRLFGWLSLLVCLVYLSVPRITKQPGNARITFERVARELGIDMDDPTHQSEAAREISDGC